MKTSPRHFLLLLGLSLLFALPSCEKVDLTAEVGSEGQVARHEGGGGGTSLNPTDCQIPVIRDFLVSSTCTRNAPCANQPTNQNTTVNCIRWRVGNDCGDYYYDPINGTPIYRLYSYSGIVSGTQCERFNLVGSSFSCNNLDQFVATTTLQNNTRYFLAVSNVAFSISSIYKDPFGYYHAGSCTDNTTWGITDFMEFTTGNGKGLSCRIGPIEHHLPG